MNDSRKLGEIMAEHPGPWSIGTMPGIRNGLAEVQIRNATGVVVPMFTLIRVAMLTAEAVAKATKTGSSA
jgi:hypothetical protein